MTINRKVEPGNYILGSHYLIQDKREHHEFGIIIISPFEQGAEKTGQWYAKFRTFEDPEMNSQIRQVIISIACRLGLLPVHFAPQFEEALHSHEPLCLVADTNSLLHGSLLQALRLREGKPTHLAIPDQVYMEMQRQRERYASRKTTVASLADWLKTRREQSMQVSAARSLRRLKKLGMIVHYIRPPEAMVRYFGSERGSATSEEQSDPGGEAGPNYHRDRLILEATRTQRTLLPHIPAWLVTSDANLSIQAKVEDFQVGYSWLPELSEIPVLTSPYFEPRTLTPQYLAVEEFLDEWLWNWEKVTLQLSGQANRKVWELPARGSRQRTLLELDDKVAQTTEDKIAQTTIEAKTEKCPRRTTEQVFNQVTHTTVVVPNRAPSPSLLCHWLQIIAGVKATEPQETIKSEVASYLCALHWGRKDNGSLQVTDKGRSLAERLTKLTDESVVEWYEWIYDANQEVLSLPPQQKLLEALPILGWKGDEDLAKELGMSSKDIASQSALANAVGLIVRLSGKSYKTEWKTPPEAAHLIFDTASQLQQQAPQISDAVRVDKVFTTLLNTSPLSLPVFRAGLFELYTTKKIRLGGSIPDQESKTATKMKVIVPDCKELREVNLGAGDFLIPNQSSQVIILEN